MTEKTYENYHPECDEPLKPETETYVLKLNGPINDQILMGEFPKDPDFSQMPIREAFEYIQTHRLSRYAVHIIIERMVLEPERINARIENL